MYKRCEYNFTCSKIFIHSSEKLTGDHFPEDVVEEEVAVVVVETMTF